MLSVDEYIRMRKNKLRMNELEQSSKVENMKKCLEFVVDYFVDYLNPENVEFLKNVHDGKHKKYKHEIRQYDGEVNHTG